MIARVRRLFWFTAAVWLLGSGSPLLAQSDSPVIDSQARIAYGQQLTFELILAESAASASVTLWLQVDGAPHLYRTEVEVEEKLDGSQTAVFDIAPGESFAVPAFATITYWWSGTSAAGDAWQSEPETVRYADTQFLWETAVVDAVTIYWVGDEKIGQAAVDVAAQVQQSVNEYNSAPLAPVAIYIYPSMMDIRAALRLAGQERLTEEVDVVLLTAVNVRTVADDLKQTMPPALIQFWTDEQLPDWLLAGLLTRLDSGAPAESTADWVETAVSMDHLCAASESSFNLVTYPHRDQSVALLTQIERVGGPAAVERLLAAYRAGGECGASLETAVGWSGDRLLAAARTGQPPALALVDSRQAAIALVFIFLGSSLLTGFLVKR